MIDFIIYKLYSQKANQKQTKAKHKQQKVKLPTRVIRTAGNPLRLYGEWPTSSSKTNNPCGMRLEAGLEGGRSFAPSGLAKLWCHGAQAPSLRTGGGPSSWPRLLLPPLVEDQPAQDCQQPTQLLHENLKRLLSWGLSLAR